MKKAALAFCVILSGCGTAQWVRAPQVSEADCTASCNAHYDQCPQIFSGFPERGAVECPAEHNNCLKACTNGTGSTRAVATPPAQAPAAPVRPAPAPAATPPRPAVVGSAASVPASSTTSSVPAGSKEARLRELKHFYDEGLVTEDVYRDRQKAILAEP
jgi:hypothetical protein